MSKRLPSSLGLAWNLTLARALGWGKGRSWGFWAWLLCAQAGSASAFQRTAPELGPSDFSQGSHQVGGEAALLNPWPWEGPLPFPAGRGGGPALAPWWLQQHL